VKRALASTLDGLTAYPAVLTLFGASLQANLPEGGFYLWVRTPIDDCGFARTLHRDYNVLVLPGSYLARQAHDENPGAGHIRIALAAPLSECVEASERIARFAGQL
jgi:N-succinyldiaminopimelate aminotransferase